MHFIEHFPVHDKRTQHIEAEIKIRTQNRLPGRIVVDRKMG
jgi:hypothetical protein